MKCSRIGTIRLFVMVLAALAASSPTYAAQPPDETKKKVVTETKKTTEAPKVEILSLRLKYIRAPEAAALLSKLLSGRQPDFMASYTTSWDQRTNTLLVRSTSPGTLAEVRDVIKRIDVPGDEAEAPPPKISIFPLRTIDGKKDNILKQSLQLAFGSGKGDFAIDPLRKVVVVAADPGTTERVQALLARLDSLVIASAKQALQVRVVWLVSGEQEKMPNLPDDLKEMLPGLAKLGIVRPRLAAQFVVNSQPNAQFLSTGTASLGQSRCVLTVQGTLTSDRESPGMRIVIEANETPPGQNVLICHLETDIQAPLGHLVVIGVAPTENVTSAFVVQLLRKEDGRAEKKK